MTVRVRLGLAYAAALAGSLAVVGGVVWWQQGIALRSALDERLATRLDAVETGLEEEGESEVLGTDDLPSDLFAVVMDTDGALVAASAGVPEGLPASGIPEGSSELLLEGARYVVTSERLDDGRVAVVGASLDSVGAAQASLAALLLLVGGAAALTSLAGGWWLAGRALRPVGEITAEAAAIGSSDLDRRLPVPARQDELGHLARTLNAMLERIAAGVRGQRAFLAAASHDLRTPVAALQTELELADRPDATADELRGALRAARADAVRLGELTGALLDLVAAGSDGRSVVRTGVPLSELVGGVLRHVAPLADERAIRLRPDLPDATVQVDRVRLEQALRNLAINAITYSAPGAIVEIVGRVAGDPSGASRWLTIDVLDRGPGIPEDERIDIFEPFRRGSDARGRGSGLGLSTARAAVDAHGGTLTASGRAGGGTCFSVRVPLPARTDREDRP